MRQHRFLLLMLSAGILIPALSAVGAGWFFFSHAEQHDEALAVAPMTEAFLRATVREYAELSRELTDIDDVGIEGLLKSSAELSFLARFDGLGHRRAIATGGESIERFEPTWAVKRPCFGYTDGGTPIVVTPLDGGGWIVAGVNLEAVKRTWGLPASLALRAVRSSDKPTQLVRLKGYTLPGQGPWCSELRAPKAGGAPDHFTLTIIAMAVLILCLVIALWINQTIRGTTHRDYRRALRAWETAHGKEVSDKDAASLRTLLCSIADEHRAVRETNTQLQNDKIKLEHSLTESTTRGDELDRKLTAAVSAKDHADRAHAALRDQYRKLEDQVSHRKLVQGDTWFAAVMREATDHVDDADADATKELLLNVRELAGLSKRGLKSALHVVNIGDRIKERAERTGRHDLKMLVSPFATNVYANPHAVNMLIDRLFDTIAANDDGEMTIRVMRHRSVGGEERVRIALERTGSLRQDIDIAYHGVAALAGATIRPETFDDERSALVLYFDALERDETTAPRDVDPDTVIQATRDTVRVIRGGRSGQHSTQAG